jgi:hypothetical protein
MERLDRPLTGPLQEVQAWELACVLRAPTGAGYVYLKANAPSPAFVNEGVVMATPARLFGDLVPAPLAVEMAALAAAVPGLRAACAELAGHDVPASLVHGDLHLANVARGPRGYRFFDWTDACVAHPFLDLSTMRRGSAFATMAAQLRPPLDPHLAGSTAWWLRRVLAGLAPSQG